MKLADLSGKKVCILGFGREGKAMVQALEDTTIECDLTICDQEKIQDTRYKIQSGEEWLKGIEEFDVIIKSPGIPPSEISQFSILNSQLTNSTQIFLDTIANTGAITVGVTGSKGKSTTSSLIYAMLKKAGKDALLIGNIGEPVIAHLDEVKKGTIVVMEMSSYQLMNLHTSPHIAVITSFFPEHLDYHGSLEAYMDAKKNITKYQSFNDMVFFDTHNYQVAEIAKEGHGRKIPFSADEVPLQIEDTQLIGHHNLSNIAAALAVSAELGIPESTALEAVKEFKGLPHRLEFVGTYGGIDWIDDAISTTPESTIAALDALDDRVTTIILGGQDRGYDFTALAERIAKSSVQTVILFPGSGPKIREALIHSNVNAEIIDASSMNEAVTSAKLKTMNYERTTPRMVLLSTASPSYNMFKNFEEKGEMYQKFVRELGN